VGPNPNPNPNQLDLVGKPSQPSVHWDDDPTDSHSEPKPKPRPSFLGVSEKGLAASGMCHLYPGRCLAVEPEKIYTLWG